MARRSTAQLDLELADDPPMAGFGAEAPSPRRAGPRSGPAPARSRLRRLLRWAGGLVVIAAAAFIPYYIDQFLASDPHFILPGGPEAAANPNFTVAGAVHAPRQEILHVFARDFGRSIYLMPLAERRRSLLEIDWVRDAAVSRRWPNGIAVRLVERRPVAFLILPAAGAPGLLETALVNEEGVILRPPPRAQLSLPVLHGITREQPAAARRARMRRVSELVRELQPYVTQISEIDASDAEDLVVTQVVQGRTLRLRLGSRDYLARLQSFLRNYPAISRHLPNARTFDLRLDSYFTAEDGDSHAR